MANCKGKWRETDEKIHWWKKTKTYIICYKIVAEVYDTGYYNQVDESNEKQFPSEIVTYVPSLHLILDNYERDNWKLRKYQRNCIG